MDKKSKDPPHVFKSNTEMARHYFRELMADGQEHSTKEINDYIHDKAETYGVDGKRLTDETIHSAIWYMFRQDRDVTYMQTRKGFYQKTPEEAMLENARNVLQSAAVRWLSRVDEKVRSAAMPGLPEQEYGKLLPMREAIHRAIDSVKQTIAADGFGREVMTKDNNCEAMTKDNIAIDSELIIEGDHINGYLAIWFDADKRFGLNTEGTDEYVTLRADYYPEDGRLDVSYVHRGPDAEEIATMPVNDLTAGEKDLILQLMKGEWLDELVAEMDQGQHSGMSMQ
jgi:hypothetical protein